LKCYENILLADGYNMQFGHSAFGYSLPGKGHGRTRGPGTAEFVTTPRARWDRYQKLITINFVFVIDH